MSNKETVTVEDVVAIGQTDKALLVKIEGDEVWIPQSVIHDDSEVYKQGDEGDLVIYRWFAEKEGLGEQ